MALACIGLEKTLEKQLKLMAAAAGREVGEQQAQKMLILPFICKSGTFPSFFSSKPCLHSDSVFFCDFVPGIFLQA